MTSGDVPPLVGLVLAGGLSRRMGRDKGALSFRGRTQAERSADLLGNLCSAVYVSIRRSQADLEPYRNMKTVLDDGHHAGPAAGLFAGWQRCPGAALLVLAVDMPLVEPADLASLVEERNPVMFATAFRQPNGRFEPLCAIWEPSAALVLRQAATRHGSVSLSRCLEESVVNALDPPDGSRLRSANTELALRELDDAGSGARSGGIDPAQ